MIIVFIISVTTALIGNVLMDIGMDKHEYGLTAVGSILCMIGIVGAMVSVPK